jgi:phenylpyruvate tautomerase PptA (4-oxalocrotonate tautomerase family)
MPMIDFTYPAGALNEEALGQAMERMTEALLRHEGAPDTPATRAVSWVFVHEVPAGSIHVGGCAAAAPHYRVSVTVPAGTRLHGPSPFALQRRKGLVREVTNIVLEAEGRRAVPAEAWRGLVRDHRSPGLLLGPRR